MAPLVNETIQVNEISLWFIVKGAIEHVQVNRTGENTFVFCLDLFDVYLRIQECVFGSFPMRAEMIHSNNEKGVHLVLVRGDKVCLDFKQLDKAMIFG